ncbi:MAG: nucleotide exchange factor GrpE [Gammaproteobacteria bacterium]|nr:nucleotide exchange factor GrpE [Gammaproteobacteria bacterium]
MPRDKTGKDPKPEETEQSSAAEETVSDMADADEMEQAAEGGDDPSASAGEAGNGAETGEETPYDPEALKEAVASLERDLAEARDQVLRARAEEENTRRRTARDAENARRFALTRFAGELLPVIDNFERALEVAADDSAVREGLDLSMKLLSGVLEKAGIEVVDPIGEPFDPTYHEAMATVDNPDAEPGSVTEVVQKGYVLNGRLLRAARVLVAKRDAS